MKSIINILHVVSNAGISRKTQIAYDMRMAQCVVEMLDADGKPAPLIGELLLPKIFHDTKPGRYEVDFAIAVGNDKRVGSVVASMTPVDANGKHVPVPAAAPAAPVAPTAKAS